MSAFVCNDKTINRIVANFKHFNRSSALPYIPDEIGEFVDFSELGLAMYKMNINAVEQRYPDCVGNPNNLPGQIDENGNHLPYHYRDEIPCSPIQFYKSLKCFLYQCSEGDVEELPLFKTLDKYLDNLAHYLVGCSENYKKSDWG